LEHVSALEEVKKLTASQNCLDDILVNLAIKNGDWRSLFDANSLFITALVLDLDVWASLQSMVEKAHYMKHCHLDALVNTVNHIWNIGKLDQIIGKVFSRLEKMLALIIEGKGGNDCVEDKRGVKYQDLKFDFNLNTRN